MKTGFIYPAIDKLLNSLRYINLVELFKLVGRAFVRTKRSERSTAYERIAVDLFIVAKFVYITALLFTGSNNAITTAIVWYLLATNIYTYFYYHLWSSRVLKDKHFNIDRIKRRFLSLMLAIFYSIFGFAYLYKVPYVTEFSWYCSEPTIIRSLLFSIYNSFAANYDRVKPATDTGFMLTIVQLLMMFVFLTIIISNSIPQITSNYKEK